MKERVRAPAVVVIHGALRSRVGLWPSVMYLRGRGFDARAFGYNTRNATLAEHGAALAEFIEAWRGERPLEPLGILTHSMGGLVARAYLARPEARAQSEHQRLVMLAPPNQGSHLAAHFRDLKAFRWLYGAASEELQPARVAELPPPPPSTAVLVLAGGRLRGEAGYLKLIPGNNDGVVGFSETVLPGIEPLLIGGSHTLLQYRPAVLERAARFLRGEDDGGAKPERPPEPGG